MKGGLKIRRRSADGQRVGPGWARSEGRLGARENRERDSREKTNGAASGADVPARTSEGTGCLDRATTVRQAAPDPSAGIVGGLLARGREQILRRRHGDAALRHV